MEGAIVVQELKARYFLKKTRADSIATAATILIDTLLCVTSLFMITYVQEILWVSLALSFVTGFICVWRFNGFKHFMKTVEQNQLSQTIKTKLSGYFKLFDKNSIILSVFDFVSTFIIVLAIGTIISDAWIGMLVRIGIMTVRVGNNAVQLAKLARALRAIALASGIYVITRGKRFMKGGTVMKSLFKWIKSNPRTLAAVGTLLAAVTTTVLQWIGTLNLGEIWGPVLSGGLGMLGAVFAGWAGFETPTTAAATEAARQGLKTAAKEEAKLNKLATEQLKLEKESKAKAEAEAEAKRLDQIKAALQAEAAKKASSDVVISQ